MKDYDTNAVLEGAAFSVPSTRNEIDVLADTEMSASDAGSYRAAAELLAVKWADVKGMPHVGLTIEDGGKQMLFRAMADVMAIPHAMPVTATVVADVYDAAGRVTTSGIFLN